MKCPVCTTVNLVMSERQGVEIDYCPECRGVWLDRGELDKIIGRTTAQESATPQPAYQPQQAHYGHGYDHGHGQSYGHSHKPYKKKSFFEELFD